MTTDTREPTDPAVTTIHAEAAGDFGEELKLMDLARSLGDIEAVARTMGWTVPEARRQVRRAFRHEGEMTEAARLEHEADKKRKAEEELRQELLEHIENATQPLTATVGEYSRRNGLPTFEADVLDALRRLKAERTAN